MILTARNSEQAEGTVMPDPIEEELIRQGVEPGAVVIDGEEHPLVQAALATGHVLGAGAFGIVRHARLQVGTRVREAACKVSATFASGQHASLLLCLRSRFSF